MLFMILWVIFAKCQNFAHLLFSEKNLKSKNMDELYLILKHPTWIFQMSCEIILDFMENNIFHENQKSADRIAKSEYLMKVVTYSKSADHMLKNHVRNVHILLHLNFFEPENCPRFDYFRKIKIFFKYLNRILISNKFPSQINIMLLQPFSNERFTTEWFALSRLFRIFQI